MLLELEQTTQLCSGLVLQAAGQEVLLRLAEDEVWAHMALAYPYQAAVGDTLLVIGQAESWYVIGVIRGTGTTTLTVPGDLRIQAPRGTIELAAGHGLRLRGSVVKIVAGKLECVARSLRERFHRVSRWVQGACQLRAGRVRTKVDGDYRVQAERILERAAEDVKIDGKKIHLG